MNIHDLLFQSIGKKVIHSSTGGCVGSIWSLGFSDGMEFMINCAWRIENRKCIITTSGDDGTATIGHMNKSVEKLIGKELLSYEMSEHYDMTLYFEDNFCVRIFCNIGFEGKLNDNKYPYYCQWDFSIVPLNISVSITDSFQVVYTKYNSLDIINE